LTSCGEFVEKKNPKEKDGRGVIREVTMGREMYNMKLDLRVYKFF
jgi:hypothetical protein